VVGTSAWIQSLVLNDALEIASPVAVTFVEDCRVHLSRKGSVKAGAGWKLGWATATASEKNGIKSLNIFMKVSLMKKMETGGPLLPEPPYVHSTFINSIQ
jgi:hypothetical protein